MEKKNVVQEDSDVEYLVEQKGVPWLNDVVLVEE
jgi:hypothetical protein